MKKNSGSESPKYFRFQFTPAVIAMSIAALLVSTAAIGISVYNISKNGIHSFNDVLRYPFLIERRSGRHRHGAFNPLRLSRGR